jgi:glucokinase
MLLAGDIGGTKTDLAVYDLERDEKTPAAQREFPSGKYRDLQSIVREFLRDQNLAIDRACFAVAGPVVEGEAHITNLPWVLQEGALAQELGFGAVYLLNDLEAIAWAVPALEPNMLHTLKRGEVVQHGTIGVIAPGTGLGEAFLTWDGERYRAHASEGGHADFAPTTTEQVGLLQHLWGSYEHVSYETVCSGIGIPHLYAYLKANGSHAEDEDLARQLREARDGTPIIVGAALRSPNPSPLCRAAVELFVSILAAESGNLAVKVLATGGLYIAGGLPLHVLPLLDADRFVETFESKGRFSNLLSDIPIHVVLQRTALPGAARYALDVMQHECKGLPADVGAATTINSVNV